MRFRCIHDIILDLLESIPEKGIKKTNLMTMHKLSSKQIRWYANFLIERGLARPSRPDYAKPHTHYALFLTPKGKEAVKAIHAVRKAIGEYPAPSYLRPPTN